MRWRAQVVFSKLFVYTFLKRNHLCRSPAHSHSQVTRTHSYFPFIWHYTYLYRIWILITFGLRQHVPDFGNKFFDFSSLCEKDMTTILVGASTHNIPSQSTNTRRGSPSSRAAAAPYTQRWLRKQKEEEKSGKKRHKNLSGNSEYYRFKSRQPSKSCHRVNTHTHATLWDRYHAHLHPHPHTECDDKTQNGSAGERRGFQSATPTKAKNKKKESANTTKI